MFIILQRIFNDMSDEYTLDTHTEIRFLGVYDSWGEAEQAARKCGGKAVGDRDSRLCLLRKYTRKGICHKEITTKVLDASRPGCAFSSGAFHYE